MEIRSKIKKRMDKLQTEMEAGNHLVNPEAVSIRIMEISKFWSLLSEEDKDFLQAARVATEDRLDWK